MQLSTSSMMMRLTSYCIDSIYHCWFLSYPACIQQCPLYSHSSKSTSAIPSNATCLIIKHIIVCLSGSSEEDKDVPTFRHTHSFSILPSSILQQNKRLGYIKKRRAVCKKVLLGPFLLALCLLCRQLVLSQWNSTHTGVCLWVLVFYLGLSSTVSRICECLCRLCFCYTGCCQSPATITRLCRLMASAVK